MSGAGIRRHGQTTEAAAEPVPRDQPEHLSMVGREPCFVRFLTSKKVYFAKSSITGVVDDRGEQDRRRIPPTRIRMAGALIEAHASGHLEGQHGGDHDVVVRKFVDDHLIGGRTGGARGHEATEGGKKFRSGPPTAPSEARAGCRGTRAHRHLERSVA